jgi:phosphoribosylglycinamide formyltransferase-1
VAHLDVTFVVVTDRECGVEHVCAARGIFCRRIETKDRTEFSTRAAEALKDQGVDFVLLFFNRLVSTDLYAALPTYNIHPSLLPAFPGLRALKDTLRTSVRYIGATLHLVTEHADQGPIVAQASTPIWPPVDEAQLADISFVQRLYLALLAVELHATGSLLAVPEQGTVEFLAKRPYSATCNPSIVDHHMLSFIRRVEEERGIHVTEQYPEAPRRI